MKRTLLFLVLSVVARADFSDDQLPAAPDILARVISAAERNGTPLRSIATKDEPTVYYLRSAEYIGQVEAPFGSVHIARLFYIRSGVRGQQTPPPRGHTFIVFLDWTFTIRDFWTVDYDFGRLSVSGTKLLLDDKHFFDYARIPEHYAELPHNGYPHPPTWK